MSAEQALYSALNVPSVTSLAPIHPDFLPEKTAYPAIVYARTGTDPVNSISSVHFGDFVSLSVTAWAKTRTAADEVADEVEAALRAAGHNVTGRDSGFDSETGLLASSITVVIFA